MGTPSSAKDHHEYDSLYHLLEEGRSWSPPAPAAAAATAPSPHAGAPGTTTSEPPRKRTPAWASAIRGFSNTLWVVIMVFLVAPLAMRLTNKEEVFLCVSMFILSFAFPVMGYVFTWDQP